MYIATCVSRLVSFGAAPLAFPYTFRRGHTACPRTMFVQALMYDSKRHAIRVLSIYIVDLN